MKNLKASRYSPEETDSIEKSSFKVQNMSINVQLVSITPTFEVLFTSIKSSPLVQFMSISCTAGISLCLLGTCTKYGHKTDIHWMPSYGY